MTMSHEGRPGVAPTAPPAEPRLAEEPERRSGSSKVDAHDSPPKPNRDIAAHRDLVRWGPLWAGVLVTLATYLVMQLGIFSLDLFEGGSDAGTWFSAVAGLLAFFFGGLATGTSALWHKVNDGLLNGAILWAFATVGLVLLALLGGGTLAGPVARVAADLVAIQELNLQGLPPGQVGQALEGARDAAAWALLGMGLSFVGAVAGGGAGAKIWPSKGTPGATSQDARDISLR